MTDGQATCAVLVDEWVVVDDGHPIRVGDAGAWGVRPPNEDEAAFVAPVRQSRATPHEAELPVFVWHAEDPEPPVKVTGRVVSIRALVRDTGPSASRTHSSRLVTEAWIDWSVEAYLIDIAGTIRPYL